MQATNCEQWTQTCIIDTFQASIICTLTPCHHVPIVLCLTHGRLMQEIANSSGHTKCSRRKFSVNTSNTRKGESLHVYVVQQASVSLGQSCLDSTKRLKVLDTRQALVSVVVEAFTFANRLRLASIICLTRLQYLTLES